MADTKISALADVVTLAAGDKVPVADASDLTASKSATMTEIVTYLQSVGMPRVARLGSQHSIGSTTGTKVTGLDMTLEVGTFVYKYTLLIQQATNTADAPQFGINFSTGTATVKAHGLRFWDATTAITAETHIMDNIGIKTAGFVSGMVSNAYTTTSPDMGTTIGVAATGANIMCHIEGIIVVTVQGNLELWRSSETAAASTTEVGSSLVVIRTA